jgi:hypothetical protein
MQVRTIAACQLAKNAKKLALFWQNAGFMGENLRSGIRDQKNADWDSWSPTLRKKREGWGTLG